MKKRNLLFGIITSLLLIIPFVNAVEESLYLSPPGTVGEDYQKIYQPSLQQGDIVYWRFTTYEDEFEVLLIIGGITVSQGKTMDSGIYNVPNDGILQINFMNDDLEWFRSGWIDIEISINEPLSNNDEPEEPDVNNQTEFIFISGYNLLFLVYFTIGITALCVLIVIQRRVKFKSKD